MTSYQNAAILYHYGRRNYQYYRRAARKEQANEKTKQMIYVLVLGLVIGLLVSFAAATYFVVQITNSFNDRIGSVKVNYEMQLASYQSMVETRDADIESLNATVDSLRAEVQAQHEHDAFIYEEYHYVLDAVSEDSPITLDVLDYADMKCKVANINTHLIWGIADTESGYDTTAQNANSSARGMFQFLESTARTFYEDSRFLNHGKGTYQHNMITDPYVAIDLMVEYISYLRDTRNADVYQMLYGYRGVGGEVLQSYYNDVKTNMANQGHDITNVYYEG